MIPADSHSLNLFPQSADLGGQCVVFTFMWCQWLGDCDYLVSALPVTIIRLINFIRCPSQFLDIRTVHGSQDFPDTIREAIPPQVEDEFIGREGAG